MKINIRHILFLGFLSVVLSACEIGLSVDRPTPTQVLVAPTEAQIQAKLQAPATADYCMEPGYAWGCITLDECTTAPGSAPVTDIVYEMTGLPAWLTFDPDTRELCLSIGSAVVPAHTVLISFTYTCYSASDPTVRASVDLGNDCDGGGFYDGGEDANSAMPAVTENGSVSLTLRNRDEYLVPGPGNFTRLRSNLVYPMDTGMDVFDPLDDSTVVSPISDIDGDNDANINDRNVFVRTSDASLTGSTIINPRNTSSIVALDLNDDYLPDLAVANDDGLGIVSRVSTYLNNGAGGFALVAHNIFAGVTNRISDMSAGAIGTACQGLVLTIPLDNRFVTVDGDCVGDLKLNQTFVLPGLNPILAVVQDFNEDTFLDVGVATMAPDDKLRIYLNNGFGFVALANTYDTCNAPTAMSTGDIDADGHPDIVMTCNPAGRVWAFYGSGNGQFGAVGSYAGGSGELTGLTIADLDQDGNLDFAIGSTTAARELQVILCNGDRTCQAVVNFDVNSIKTPIAADLNGDGFIDIAGVGGPGLRVLINDGSGLGYAETTYDLGGPNGVDITAADFTGYNIIDLANTNSNGPGLENINIWLQ